MRMILQHHRVHILIQVLQCLIKFLLLLILLMNFSRLHLYSHLQTVNLVLQFLVCVLLGGLVPCSELGEDVEVAPDCFNLLVVVVNLFGEFQQLVN